MNMCPPPPPPPQLSIFRRAWTQEIQSHQAEKLQLRSEIAAKVW